ncbi:MAG TPA: sodium:calcium antiporter [Candidatus Paceibacterota bacterium]|nr:sodium:calcium antiporter [Candidatus Paceibacterota bacterium]
MIIINLILFGVFLIVLIKSAEYAIKFSSRLAKIFKFPEFVVSFFIIALISVLPEAIISVISAFKGEPELGLGTLLGSNVADLTLVFGIVALFASRNGVKVKSKILRDSFFYLTLLIFPLILGFDGILSRKDGIILILLGSLFFFRIYSASNKFHKKFNHTKKYPFIKTLLFLFFSLGAILLSAFFTVKFAVNFANDAKLPSVLIGLTIIAIGTCLPELIFSIKAVRRNHDDLALGDILGTVVTDATIILGTVALISPFSYNPINIYTTGTAMFLAGVFAIVFMKSDKSINKFEGLLLIFIYIAFIFIEFLINSVGIN